MDRSENMRRIRSRDTKPEMRLRRFVFSLGYRYRLHGKHLPGKPDLVFAGRRKVIFLHGCFWHQHEGCKIARVPKTNLEYWEPKLSRNVQRDADNIANLKAQGWDVLVIWECELKNEEDLAKMITSFLGCSPGLSLDFA